MKRLIIVMLALAVSAAATERPAAKYFRGVTLVDQNGKTVDVYDDLMAGRTVVVHSFFASCTTTCPIMAQTLGAIQERFAERLGKELVLISITVDPENDTPAKLSEYAKRIGARSGWYFLTGSREQVGLALRKFGQATEQRESHLNIFAVGNETTGLWKKALALATRESLLEIVRTVLEDQPEDQGVARTSRPPYRGHPAGTHE